MRFEEKLQVRYDIACMDFRIPALTLEPLVENAVRHGVRGNPGGSGTVVISTSKTPDYYEVAVSDDGPGFDPEQPIEDGRPHVGIANVLLPFKLFFPGFCNGVGQAPCYNA